MSDFRRGLFDSSSIMLGYFPAAISFGVAAVGIDVAPWLVVLISVFIYAGASQFILLLLIVEQTPVLSMVFIVIAVNLRHLFYGPALLSELGPTTYQRPYKLMAFGLTDEVFATARARIGQLTLQKKEQWYLGLQLGAYSSWVLGTVVGAYVASDWLVTQPVLQQSLAFVLPALFFALLLDMAALQGHSLLGVVALSTFLVSFVLPAHASLLVGMLVGGAWAWMQQLKREKS